LNFIFCGIYLARVKISLENDLKMKKLFNIIIVSFIAVSAIYGQDSMYLFSYFINNGEDGLHLAASKEGYFFQEIIKDRSWIRPELSKDKLMRDPCIISGSKGGYHMVWTVSWNDKGIGYAYSEDLINWGPQLYIPVMQHEDSALNCWAPEITYDEKKKRYLIYWATTIPGRFTAGSNTGDSRYNHRMYYTTTSDFKKFSPAKLLIDPGFNVIDATIFKMAKNKWGMVLKDETRNPPQKNLKLSFSHSLNTGWSKPGPPLTGKEWAEGPSIIKLGDSWIIYFDKYMDKKYGAISSADLIQWQDISEKVFFPEGARHGTVLKVPLAVYEKLLKAQ
jgi:hypothetical protein